MTTIILYMLIAFVAVVLALGVGCDLLIRRQWGMWPWHTPLYRLHENDDTNAFNQYYCDKCEDWYDKDKPCVIHG